MSKATIYKGIERFDHRIAWSPLESNPEVISKFISDLGSPLKAADVYGLDPELLAFVPKPVRSLIFLFPCTEKFPKLGKPLDPSTDRALFVYQMITNACGAMAIIHSLLNCPDEEKGDYVKSLKEKFSSLSPFERAWELEDEKRFEVAHTEGAASGDTEELDPSSDVDLHFIAFVPSEDGSVIELDGRKEGPIDHGKIEPGKDFLESAASVIQKYIEGKSDPRFALVAIVGSE
ncbi:ubiquitin carboxyl-terminal hydrolase [Aduncisulcus paluster]|uniref:Ubiquitin carboxyl-terminal hydrolase n=1 Tax=Aduncisulcus paluster TaxID=2918883 RepID=A0ABQ5JXE0_9EUKA|nr:ubiquitin carboxyl-terminal hydrolase [Aduncisulcus paluster]